MKLNTAEKALMNNPVRAAVQRHYEARLLERLGGTVHGAHVLEGNCCVRRRGDASNMLERVGASQMTCLSSPNAAATRRP